MILSELRASAWKYATLLFAALAVVAVIGCALFRGRADIDRLRADAAEQRSAQSEARAAALTLARNQEHAKAEQIAAIADQYEQDKANAQKAADRTIADLRAGNLRLQNRWRGCVSGAPAAPGEPDAAAADREQGAADIVRASAEADATIRALQDIVKADRK